MWTLTTEIRKTRKIRQHGGDEVSVLDWDACIARSGDSEALQAGSLRSSHFEWVIAEKEPLDGLHVRVGGRDAQVAGRICLRPCIDCIKPV